MKVLLTAPPRNFLSSDVECIDTDLVKRESIPALAIYQLASILREKGHSTEVLDPISNRVEFLDTDTRFLIKNQVWVDFAEYTPKFLQFPTLEKQIHDVDVVGVSSTSLDWFLAKAMIERIKSIDPDLIVVVGGVHAAYADEHILKNSKVDFVVRREGEKTLPELLNALEKNRNLKEVLGLSYKNNGNIIKTEDRPPLTIPEMEETPLPAFDLMPSNIHGKISVETSRGCKFSCVFCSIPFKNIWRGLSPEVVQKRVEHALDYTKKLYGKEKTIHIIDDTFTADRKRAEKILYNFSEIDLKDMRLFFEARANDLLNSNIVELCTKIPLQHIQMGVESGYDQGLKKIRKITTIHNIEKCASLLKKYGISEYLSCSFIIAFPWEYKEDCFKTIDFAYKLVSEYDIGISGIQWIRILPGSYLWNNRKFYGINEGLEIYDSTYALTKEFIFKVSSKLKEEDLIDIKKRVDIYQFMLLLGSKKGYIQQVLPYCNGAKMIM